MTYAVTSQAGIEEVVVAGLIKMDYCLDVHISNCSGEFGTVIDASNSSGIYIKDCEFIADTVLRGRNLHNVSVDNVRHIEREDAFFKYPLGFLGGGLTPIASAIFHLRSVGYGNV